MDLVQWVGFLVDGLVQGSELLLEYVKVLAWPGVVFTLAMVYRRPLFSILHRLKNATVGGTSIDLAAELLAEDSAKALEATQAAPHGGSAPGIEAQSSLDSGGVPVPGSDTESPLGATQHAKDAPEVDAADGVAAQTPTSTSTRHHAANWTFRRSTLTPRLRLIGSWEASSPQIRNIPMMILAWRDLEAEAEKIGKLLDMTPNNSKNLPILGFELKRLGYMTEENEDLMLRLADLRGALERKVEDIEINDSTGAAFVESVANITDILRAARRSLESNRNQPPAT